MNYIKRAITPILQKRVESTKCVLVTGARQVGKSTLIKHDFPYFNKADFDESDKMGMFIFIDSSN